MIIDSLSMPILCSVHEPKKRPHYFSWILNKLHRLTLQFDIAVRQNYIKIPYLFFNNYFLQYSMVFQIVVTNELVVQVDKDGKTIYSAAGGQHVADYSYVKLELTRLSSDKFATRLVKSSIMPELTVTFKVTK